LFKVINLGIAQIGLRQIPIFWSTNYHLRQGFGGWFPSLLKLWWLKICWLVVLKE